MFRYALAIAAAIGLMSNAALAETNAAGTTKVITKAAPTGVAQKKVVIKRNNDRYAGLVSKKKIVRGEAMYGSSMPPGHKVIKKRMIVNHS
jgi:hypothetical protein